MAWLEAQTDQYFDLPAKASTQQLALLQQLMQEIKHLLERLSLWEHPNLQPQAIYRTPN